MNSKPISVFMLCLLAGTSMPAHAAGMGMVVTVGGYVIAAALAAYLYFRFTKIAALQDRSDDLELRLAQSEKAVSQLQNIRGELTKSIEQARADTQAADDRRKETADMLASLRIQVERVARIDGLTGVANRQQFDTSLVDEIKRGVRERKDVSLLLVEVDSFLEYRDINGEQKADYVLQKVARTISDSFRRAGDLVARIGEQKFGVLLPGADATTSTKFAEKLRRTVYSETMPFPASEIADRITISIGLVSLPPVRLHKSENVVGMAENALRDAQNNGHNRIAMSEHAA